MRKANSIFKSNPSKKSFINYKEKLLLVWLDMLLYVVYIMVYSGILRYKAMKDKFIYISKYYK